MQYTEQAPYCLIGLRTNKNVYSAQGALLLPAGTRLTGQCIDRLQQYGIQLQADDVEPFSGYSLLQDALQEVRDVFRTVRETNYIPVQKLYEQAIPLIIEISEHPQLHSILTHLERHDQYTYRHSVGVAMLARLIGKAKGYNSKQLFDLTVAGFLHDIGKARISESIINKPGRLTPEEFEQIKHHTIYGYEIISNTPGIERSYALVALQHHEREDGSGYPHGCRGSELDHFSKIVAVADVFHAMVSKRTYKDPISFHHVLQEMSNHAYGSFETESVLVLVRRIMDMLIGNEVILSNGRQGKIVMVNTADPLNPLVQVNGSYIDLSKHQSLHLHAIK